MLYDEIESWSEKFLMSQKLDKIKANAWFWANDRLLYHPIYDVL